MKSKCYVDYGRCLTQWLIFVHFPNVTPNFRSTGPDLTTIYYHRKFSKWNRFRLDSFRHDISSAIWVTSSETGLASHLAPITWVTTRATVSQGFFPWLFIAMLWTVTIWSSLEVFSYKYSGLRWFKPGTLGSVGGRATNSATPPP
jgi:hypothetical protein